MGKVDRTLGWEIRRRRIAGGDTLATDPRAVAIVGDGVRRLELLSATLINNPPDPSAENS